MADLVHTFEAGVHAANVTTGEASPNAFDSVLKAATGNVVYDNTHSYDLLSAKVSNVTAGHHAFCRWNLASLTDHYGRCYYYVTAYPTSLASINDGYSTASQAWVLVMLSNGTLSVRDGINTALGGAVPMSLNQWVRVEYHIIHSTSVGQIEVKIFNNPDSITPSETITTPANRNTRANATLVDFGMSNAPSPSAATSYWIDNAVAAATAYPGPVPVPPYASVTMAMDYA